jgi:hypothetical protein
MFDDTKLSLTVDTIGGGQTRIFVYTAPPGDGEDVFLGQGYFQDVNERGVRVNDVILVVEAGQAGVYICQVNQVDAAGNATVEILERPAEIYDPLTVMGNPTNAPAKSREIAPA